MQGDLAYALSCRYVKAGKTGAVEITIASADVGSKIRWEVEVAGGYDVDFSIRSIEVDSGKVTFPRKERLKGKASGTFSPIGKGSLRFEFGNTFSWLRGKTVDYKVDFGDNSTNSVIAAAAAAATK